MTDLFWPGEQRAEDLMTDQALVRALVEVELQWYLVLAAAGIAPTVELPSRDGLAAMTPEELSALSAAAEDGGNPVIPLLGVLRTRLELVAPELARWLHKGLTSQDVLDTALVLQLRTACREVLSSVGDQVRALRDLAARHRGTLAAGRTLTQHAVPTTFGLTAAGWLTGVLDAADDLGRAAAALPVQVGGAAGTLAAVATLAAGDDDPAGRALRLAADLATRLDLRPSAPWHTNRVPLTRVGDALVAAVGAWSHLANDVLVRARPEIGELSEGVREGRGGSSTMPHKQNPVLAVLVRRAGLSTPHLGAALHAAAAAALDERPDGGWHAEWSALQGLARQSVVAASQTAELVAHLVVHEERMRETAERAGDDLLAERRALESFLGVEPSSPRGPATYLGATDRLVDAALERADAYLTDAA